MVKNKEFVSSVKGHYTPIDQLLKQLLLPVPQEVGQIQCTITRDKKGLNKFWPKYTLHLNDAQKTVLLSASFVKTAKTPHIRIEIKTDN